MTEHNTLARTFNVYIPRDRWQALLLGELLPDRTNGSALFADISGFTPLTAALARTLGPRLGAEELTHQLNRVYDALIAEVECYDGSVIGFAGDAITCWFTGDSPDAPLRAVACAFAMQQAMQQFSAVALPGGETVTLAMKASIASGPARRFLVGDPDIQYIDALAGETLVRMAAAEHLANRGEVLVDHPTVTALEDVVRVREWRVAEGDKASFAVVERLQEAAADREDGSRPQPASAQAASTPFILEPAVLRPWLLPEVYEGFTAGVGESLELRRGVVSLFLCFQGIDYDNDEQAGEKLDRYIRWVQGVIRQYNGALLQLIIGDKGNYLYAAFGAPTAHENDPQRAVSAALDLLALPPDLDFVGPLQIGVGQGTMRTGAYGSTTRRTYGVIGDAVNLSARLMQNAAPGTVLVTQALQAVLVHAFEWESLPDIRVKGKDAPVPVVRPRRKKQTPSRSVIYSGELVGREAELRQLVQAIQPIFAGRDRAARFAGVVYVHGEPGVGKTRLIYELQQQVQAQSPLAWFVCPTDPILRQSLNPFRYFLRQYFGQNSDNTEEVNKVNFTAALNTLIERLRTERDGSSAQEVIAELQRTRSMLGALVDLYWEGSLYEQLEPELRFRNTLLAFKTLVQAESRLQPVILHIEDVHWLDPDSQELLVALTRNVRDVPFAVLLSGRYRDDGSQFTLPLDADVPQETLDLNTLSLEGTRALAEQVLDGPLSEALTDFLRLKTEGNPLFVEQLTLDLRERALLHRDKGTWDIVSREVEAVPATINAVLIARLDRLAAQVKAVVQTAAVLGREFEVLILSRMLHDDVELPRKVQRAEEEMIWSALNQMHYIFRHTMMRDAAYDMQLQTRLRDLHALAAGVMVQVYAADLESHYADLAYHYGKAENAQQEYHYARLAGKYAASRYANQEAIEHYQQALQSLSRLDLEENIVQRQDIYAALAELQITIGQYDQAHEHLEHALDLAVQVNDGRGRVHVCRWMAQMYQLQSEYDEALKWIKKGLYILNNQRTSDAAELRLIAGLIHTRRGNYDEATAQFQNALHIAQYLNETAALARAHNGLGLVRLRDNTTMAIEHFQQAFILYVQAGVIPGQAMSHNLMASAYFDTGEWDQADTHYRQAREIFEKIGDVYHAIFADNNLGEIALYQGRLDEALAFYRQALRALELLGGSTYVLGALHMNLGHVFIRRGETDKACRELHTAQEHFEQAQARDFLPELYCHYAEAYFAVDDLDTAEGQARRALDLSRELERRGEEGYGLRILALVVNAQGHPEDAETRLKQSLEILDAIGDHYQKAQTQLALAQFYAQQNDSLNAREVLEQCVPVFQRLGVARDLNAAHALLATL
ncbi:MAG: tetratricopeptide repeat protein [Anaerolineae bacterium]|nr:tetratricopeptide repeat protein [Anaerolineae bacterium]